MKLPGFSFKTHEGGSETAKAIVDPEASVDRHAGSYHLDYQEKNVRKHPTILKVLGDAGRRGVTAANLSPKDITHAIGIVELRLSGIKHENIVLTEAQTGRKKYKNAKAPILDCIPSWLSARALKPGNASANASGESRTPIGNTHES